MSFSEPSPDEDEVVLECPDCSATATFHEERIRAWKADSDTNEEFDHFLANPVKDFPMCEPCGSQMAPRE